MFTYIIHIKISIFYRTKFSKKPVLRERRDCSEKLITVKCQTLGPGRAVKEVDIQLPVDIFNRMLDQNGNSDPLKRDLDLSLSRKIRNIFIR